MGTSRPFSSLFLALTALTLLSAMSYAADPGIAFPADGVVNDQKAGSVLIYNVYTSSPTNPTVENTRITLTNISNSRTVSVHLFFVDGSTCGPADSIVCLTPNQTTSFRASDFDPGIMGYIVAVAVDNNGCPIVHNALIGEAFVKFSSGHSGNLGAEAIAARQAPVCDQTANRVDLPFDGITYDQLPATIAVDNIPSRLDGNDTLIIIIRPSGNLALGADTIGPIAGLLYNDTEAGFSFGMNTNVCQLRFSFSNTVPRTVPRFTTVVPSGHTGWVKFFTFTGAPLLGAVFNFNSQTSMSQSAFNGGHNMHKLRLTTSSFNIPVFPPNC